MCLNCHILSKTFICLKFIKLIPKKCYVWQSTKCLYYFYTLVKCGLHVWRGSEYKKNSGWLNFIEWVLNLHLYILRFQILIYSWVPNKSPPCLLIFEIHNFLICHPPCLLDTREISDPTYYWPSHLFGTQE